MTPQATGAPVLEARRLVKKYGNVTAINGADFELRAGEVLAVIGDNGAGKSSLIKALAGAVIPDSGEILMNGTPVSFKSTRDARAAGIETVYQDLAVVPALDIASNLYLGREVRRKGIAGSLFRRLDMPRMRQEASQHLADLKIGIKSVNQAVETLSGGGQRQGVAVARAAAFGRGGDHHGRADRRARGSGVRTGHRPDQVDPRPRYPPRGAHQPRHAARVRGVRPHPHPPARATCRRRRSEEALDVRGGRAHDRCRGAHR